MTSTPAGKREGSSRVWSGRRPWLRYFQSNKNYDKCVRLVSQLVAKFALIFENSDSLGKPRYGPA